MTRYGMAIDTLFCVGCDQCSVACKVEHNLPDGVWWTRARTSSDPDGFACGRPEGTYPNLKSSWYTSACQHCDNPPCLEVCPTGATVKREDGIVVVDQSVCIGCKSCIAACPYDARTLLEGEPAWALEFPVGDQEAPEHIAQTTEKCTFCVERIDRGERPACVDVCQAVARYFGDLDDPNSEVSKVLAERDYDQLLADQGTSPNVYFLK